MGSSPPRARSAAIAAMASLLLAGGIVGLAYLASPREAPELARGNEREAQPVIPGSALSHPEAEPIAPAPELAGGQDARLSPELPSRPIRLVGRIFQEVEGEERPSPLAGARVSLRVFPPDDRSTEMERSLSGPPSDGGVTADPDATVFSGTDGRFALMAPDAGAVTSLQVDAPGLGQRGVELPRNLSSHRRQEHDLGDLILRPGTVLEVQVRAETGSPVAEAAVCAEEALTRWPAFADILGTHWKDTPAQATAVGEGRFVLTLAPASYEITVEAPGFNTKTTEVALPVEGPLEVRLEARPSAEFPLTGLIHSSRGSPVKGATVALTSDNYNHRESARSDGKGRFGFEARVFLPAKVEVSADGYQPWSSTIHSPPDRIEVTMEEGWPLSIDVVASAGQPIGGALLHLRQDNGWSRHETCDAAGKWRGRDLPAGPLQVEATHDGFLDGTSTDVELGPGLGEPRLVLQLEEGSTIQSLVVDRVSGVPIDAGQVAVTFEVDSQTECRYTVTDSTGMAKIGGIPPGASCRVEGWAHGYQELTLSDIEPSEGREPLKLALARACTVSGRVIAPDGEPVPEAIVWPDAYEDLPNHGKSFDAYADLQNHGKSFREVYPVKSRVDGSFRLEGLQCSKGYFFTAFAAGFPPSSIEDIDLEAGGVIPTIEIRLRRYGAVEGRVVGPTGSGVAGAKVTLTFVESMRNTSFGASVLPPDIEVEADGQGRFEAQNLDPGHYDITVEAPGLELRRTSVVAIQDGVAATIEVPMVEKAQPRAILGRVVDELGAPVAEAEVGVSDEDSDTHTDSDGRFRLEGVTRERAHVYALKAEHFEAGCYVTESTDELLLHLPRSGVALLKVLGPDGQALPSPTILAWPSDGGDHVDSRDVDADELPVDDPDGLAKELPTGTYVLEARSDGLLPGKSPPVLVPPSAQTELIVIQLGRGAVVRGYAFLEDGATPVEGVTVAAVPADAAQEAAPAEPPSDSTKSDGSFEISGVPEGRARLEVAHGMLAQLTFPIVQPGKAGVVTTQVILGEGGSLDGRLEGLAAAGYPLQVTPIRPDGTPEVWKAVAVGGTGVFSIKGLTPGVGSLRVYRDSQYLPEVELRLPITIRQGEVTEVHWELPPRLRLEGFVTLRGKRLPHGCADFTQDDSLAGIRYSTRTWAEADGNFALDVLPGLPGTIEVTSDDGRTKLRRPLAPPGVGVRLELELDAGSESQRP